MQKGPDDIQSVNGQFFTTKGTKDTKTKAFLDRRIS